MKADETIAELTAIKLFGTALWPEKIRTYLATPGHALTARALALGELEMALKFAKRDGHAEIERAVNRAAFIVKRYLTEKGVEQ